MFKRTSGCKDALPDMCLLTNEDHGTDVIFDLVWR